MKKIYLIINPISGLKNSLDIFDDIKPIFTKSGIKLKILETQFSGHAFQYLKNIPFDGYDGVCAIGGDGTMFEMINGMLKRESKDSIPIGLIAGGTGNALMHDLKCLDPKIAAHRILSGKKRSMDIAKITANGKLYYAFNVIGWGLPTDAVKLAEKFRWMGGFRYDLSVVIELLIGRKRISTLILDGNIIEDDFVLIIACNTIHTGKAMKIAPYAKLDDGKIDLIIVKRASKLKLLKLFPKLFTGEHVKSKLVEYKQVKKFELIPKNISGLNIDGELIGQTPLDVSMNSGMVDILI